MDETSAPRRRWFQFKVSTWFVLVGILCWALACRPWWFEFVTEQTFISLNIALAYPTLALLAFIAWKVAWLVVERRSQRIT